MATADTFTDATKELQALAVRYHRFQQNPDEFLLEIAAFGRDRLERYLKENEPYVTRTIDGTERISPVIFLRRVVVTRLLNGERLTASDVEEIKNRIEQRDTQYFVDFPNYLDALAAQKESRKGSLASWGVFSLLFYIDYGFHSEWVNERLKQIALTLRTELGLEHCDYHVAGFNYNRNFGTDRCWIALYPQELGDFKDAYQISFGVEHDGFQYGLVNGSNVEEAEDLDHTAELPPLDHVIAFCRERIPTFTQWNRELLEVAGEGDADRHPLNLILYGPPGTGKTYSVQRRAVEILDGAAADASDEEVTELFHEYRADRRIEFVTFHPSYSYEEFVEGFRYDPELKIPVLRDGVFKQLVERAVNPHQQPDIAEGAEIWKVSLGGQEDAHIFERSIRNDEIAIGWFPDRDLTGMDEEQIRQLFEEHGQGREANNIRSVNSLVNEIREGDYVAILKDQRTIRAIGLVTGEYRYRTDYKDYPHTRPVEWLDEGEHDIYEMNGSKNITMPTIYRLSRISLQDFVELLPDSAAPAEPYVLIIDEINRGNLSRIFGELITLLEPDKRLGAANETTVRLPYSQHAFTVPGNVHVIGTMNTADRSIALLDVALRRRFDFEEMMPRVDVIRDVLSLVAEEDSDEAADDDTDLSPEQVELVCTVFEILNRRITVLMDRDHQIGHSYFLDVRSMADLHRVLYRKVFPLLQEYFYNDRERLTRLLGRWEPGTGQGFVAALDDEYRAAFAGGEVPGEEMPWEFHRYAPGELGDALRTTFVRGS
jgi:5-methylcytosine-specific restriction protein B